MLLFDEVCICNACLLLNNYGLSFKCNMASFHIELSPLFQSNQIIRATILSHVITCYHMLSHVITCYHMLSLVYFVAIFERDSLDWCTVQFAMLSL